MIINAQIRKKCNMLNNFCRRRRAIPYNLHYIFPFLLTKKTMRYKENMKYLIKLSEYCTGLLLNARFKNGTMQPRCKYAL